MAGGATHQEVTLQLAADRGSSGAIRPIVELSFEAEELARKAIVLVQSTLSMDVYEEPDGLLWIHADPVCTPGSAAA